MVWLKIAKLCSCLSYFPGFFDHYYSESLTFFENEGTNLTPKQLNMMVLVNFSKVQQLRGKFFKERAATLTKK